MAGTRGPVDVRQYTHNARSARGGALNLAPSAGILAPVERLEVVSGRDRRQLFQRTDASPCPRGPARHGGARLYLCRALPDGERSPVVPGHDARGGRSDARSRPRSVARPVGGDGHFRRGEPFPLPHRPSGGVAGRHLGAPVSRGLSESSRDPAVHARMDSRLRRHRGRRGVLGRAAFRGRGGRDAQGRRLRLLLRLVPAEVPPFGAQTDAPGHERGGPPLSGALSAGVPDGDVRRGETPRSPQRAVPHSHRFRGRRTC